MYKRQFIYSTCTFNTKEDEENARWIQQEYGGEPLTVQVQEDWNITGNLLSDKGDHSKSSIPVYHFFPHKTKGEGFFLVAFRKPETEEEIPVSSSAKEKAFKKMCIRDSYQIWEFPILVNNVAKGNRWLIRLSPWDVSSDCR